MRSYRDTETAGPSLISAISFDLETHRIGQLRGLTIR